MGLLLFTFELPPKLGLFGEPLPLPPDGKGLLFPKDPKLLEFEFGRLPAPVLRGLLKEVNARFFRLSCLRIGQGVSPATLLMICDL